MAAGAFIFAERLALYTPTRDLQLKDLNSAFDPDGQESDADDSLTAEDLDVVEEKQ